MNKNTAEKLMMSKPAAVLISDIHFMPNTLDLASESLLQARAKAGELNVPLIIAGDLLDSKDVIRGVCANRLIEIFSNNVNGHVPTYVLVGNHDRLNEKSHEHSLNFLRPYVHVIEDVGCIKDKIWLLAYQPDPEKVKSALKHIPKNSTVVMHQGLQGAFMGHYVQDKSALTKDVFADHRVISGHYHKAQSIKCGRPRKGAIGLFSYIGNPYTLSFAEAEDGSKGFQVLHDSGLLKQIPTNLRKHMIVERSVEDVLMPLDGYRLGDLVWLKVKGSTEELRKLKKKEVGQKLFGHDSFKLDLIPTAVRTQASAPQHNKTSAQLLDSLIESTGESDELQQTLKTLWRQLTA